ncbi:MAG: BlaI/MecI/CopY family transcriptional regulator [Thermoplasmata archaeon]|nr:BlaI/MecI/CopY family transcriptional regulator [Thermoplasmata archaeon]
MPDGEMLGSLEAEVLLSVQELREAPARTVRDALERRGIRVAYTTVATILTRLWTKGIVRRRREPCRGGARFVYRTADFERRYLKSLLEGVVALFGPAGVVHLNEELAKLAPGEDRELRRRLKL